MDQHVNTHVRPGFILSPKGFKKGKKHPDLWGLVHNKAMWARRYVHPQLYKILAGEATAEVVRSELLWLRFSVDYAFPSNLKLYQSPRLVNSSNVLSKSGGSGEKNTSLVVNLSLFFFMCCFCLKDISSFLIFINGH